MCKLSKKKSEMVVISLVVEEGLAFMKERNQVVHTLCNYKIWASLFNTAVKHLRAGQTVSNCPQQVKLAQSQTAKQR